MTTSIQNQSQAIEQPKLPPVPAMKFALKLSNFFRKLHYKGSPAPLAIMEISLGHYMAAQMMLTIAELGVADYLKDGPKEITDLAPLVGADASYLYRVMQALVSLGVFAQDKKGRFKLNGLSRFLLSDTPGSARPLLLLYATSWHRQTWEGLTETVTSGIPAFERLNQLPFFDYLSQNVEAGQIFNTAMSGYSSQVSAAVVSAYNFSRYKKIVDIGGGIGNLTIPLLKKYSNLKGVIFDLPAVVEQAQSFVKAAGVQDRCEIIGGSFFQSVPGGADAYLINNVLHDWSDAKCLEILRICRRTMDNNAILLLSEQILPDRKNSSFHIGKLTDLEMGVFFPGGRERTLAEYKQLCAMADFKLVRAVATPSFAYVMECLPV